MVILRVGKREKQVFTNKVVACVMALEVKREFRLHQIHCGVPYTCSLGSCGLMMAGGETSGLQVFERT